MVDIINDKVFIIERTHGNGRRQFWREDIIPSWTDTEADATLCSYHWAKGFVGDGSYLGRDQLRAFIRFPEPVTIEMRAAE